MKSFLFLAYLFWTSLGDRVTYCVRSAANNNCPDSDGCQKCEVLQYYFDNVHTTINQQTNVTLIFMPGIHTVCNGSLFRITVPVMKMVGKDRNVTVTRTCGCDNKGDGCYLELMGTNVTIDNVKIKDYDIRVMGENQIIMIKVTNCSFQNSTFYSTNIKAIMAKDCVFQEKFSLNFHGVTSIVVNGCTIQDNSVIRVYDTISVILEDCQVVFNSILGIFHSTVTVQGNSKFLDQTIDNVLLSSGSTVILSDHVLFANNTAFNGGAMFLYSGTNLTIAKDANVTFSNNGLFHLISIYPLWMTFNECPAGCFDPCPGGSKIDFNEGKGVF